RGHFLAPSLPGFEGRTNGRPSRCCGRFDETDVYTICSLFAICSFQKMWMFGLFDVFGRYCGHGQARQTKIKSLMICPKCSRGEMTLFGIEPENDTRDLYTFECDKCGTLEVRGVR